MNIPQHIVLFPDGNRRWAKANGLPSLQGHLQGYNNLLLFSEWCKKRGVKVLTAFGFSTENWNRTQEEVGYLMKLLEKCMVDNLQKFQQEQVRVRVIGQRERLPDSLKKAIETIEKNTQHHTKLHLNLAVSYGGKWDIVNAVKKIAEEKMAPEAIDEKVMDEHLSTAGLPAPDLIIRPGGEMRLSNFVLWQAAYAELYFSPKMWPEFTEQDLDEALAEFDRRARRFGK